MSEKLTHDEDGGDVILTEILNQQMDEMEERIERASMPPMPSVDTKETKEAKSNKENHVQWAIGGNGMFSPVGSTIKSLPAGIYEPFASPGSWGLQLTKVASDGIYMLPDMATETVLEEVKKFWSSEKKYRDHNLLYKRGILLSGPPGGGKTVAVKILMNELVKKDGIVMVIMNVQLAVMCLKAIRRIEPTRPLIVVMEDIDEIIQFNGETHVLSMLDGEHSVDNVLNLATTNYPDKLGPRIINRPSRFDRRVKVGMPNDASRGVYLEKATNGGLTPEQIAVWVKDTDGMSIAHLRELVAAVYCLDQSYSEVIKRLSDMAYAVKGDDGFKSKGLGFAANALQASVSSAVGGF